MIKISGQTITTIDKILECAKKEFLEKGFKNASLRVIAKEAGVTTGAIYGYFKDKNAIFNALVESTIKDLYLLIDELEDIEFSELTKEKLLSISQKEHLRYIDYVYSHFDECKLLLCCSAGSNKENYLKELIEYIIKINIPYFNLINIKIDSDTNKFIIFTCIETVLRAISNFIETNVTYEVAIKRMDVLFTVIFAGYIEAYNFE